MVNILLIRHGETRWNREEVFRGQSDIPLNDFGRRQAEALGIALLNWGLKQPQFITSPLSRAHETTAIAAAAFNQAKEITKDESFIDICFGEWEGKTVKQVEKSYPEMYMQWRNNPGQVKFPGGESLDQAAERTEKGIFRLARNNPNSTQVITSHRAINKALLCRLLGLSSDSFWKLQQNTACINELLFTGKEFILVKLNDTCHLQELGKDKKDF